MDCNIQDGRKSNTASTVEKDTAKGIQKLVNAAIPRFLITRERSTKKEDWLLSLVFPEESHSQGFSGISSTSPGLETRYTDLSSTHPSSADWS